MLELQNTTATAGLVCHTFISNTHLNNETHSVCRYFISQPFDCSIILNNPETHGILVVNLDFKVKIISLPKYNTDLNSGKNSHQLT